MALLMRHSKGQILLVVAFLMMFIIGVAALAIDIGRAYGVKTKLNAAVDAASYEAAKAMAEGNVESVKIAEAKKAAANYFSANYPAAFLGATSSAPEVTAFRDEKTGVWQVSVEATANMPTFFAGALGWKSLDIKAASEAVRPPLDMVLVMDASYSLSAVLGEVKEQSEHFIDNFSELDDRFGLVVFANGGETLVSICGDTDDIENPPEPHGKECDRGYRKRTVKGAIHGLTLTSSGNRASAEGMKKALDQLKSLKKESGRRVIVLFSDGTPNTLNGKFAVRASPPEEGNLSTIEPTDRPGLIFDEKIYNDDKAVSRDVASLPETDLSGKIPIASYNGKRNFSRLTKIYDFTPAESARLKCDGNIAARNMAENVANMAREQGILVYTLGLGSGLDVREMTDSDCSTYNETGTTILKRLANTPDSDTYNSNQPTGIYCRAQSVDALGPCFEKLANAILRISK